MNARRDITLHPGEWKIDPDDKSCVTLLKDTLLFVSHFNLCDIEIDFILDDIPTRKLIAYLYDERGREVYENVSTEQQMYILCGIAAEETSPNCIYNAETLKQALADFVDKNAHKIKFY